VIPLLASTVIPGIYDGVCNPDCTAQDILVVIANAIRIGIWFAGALSVIFIIVGGIFYVISAGNPSNIKRAKDILTNAIVGLIIAGLAYSIVTFLAGKF
jgi:hypothetical protein